MAFVDSDRVQRFLDELRRTGDAQRAAAVASPGCSGRRAGYSTFYELRRRDPKFTAQWEGCLAEHRAGNRLRERFALVLVDAVEAA